MNDAEYMAHKKEQYRLWCLKNPGKLKEYERKRRPRDLMKEPIVKECDRYDDETLEQYYARKKREYYLRNRHQRLLYTAKHRAKVGNIPFDITIEDIAIPEVCPALGIPLFFGSGKHGPNSPTIDRIEPEKGYIRGNIQIISHLANAMKNNATRQQLQKFAEWIING